jgi:hypothetical protein
MKNEELKEGSLFAFFVIQSSLRTRSRERTRFSSLQHEEA